MVAMNVWPTDAADGSVANEARWRKMARHWVLSGVLNDVGGEMVPSLAYPNLTVKNGACWVDGHFCELLGDQVLTVTPNGLAVVRFDPAANTAELIYRDGATTPSQSPTGVWEQPIAKLSGSALTDARGPLVGAEPELRVYAGVSTVTTDAFGNAVIGPTQGLPAGAKVVGGIAQGAQRDYPMFMVLNSTDIPLGGAGIAWKVFTYPTATAVANSPISMAFTIWYRT